MADLGVNQSQSTVGDLGISVSEMQINQYQYAQLSNMRVASTSQRVETRFIVKEETSESEVEPELTEKE